MSGDRRRQNPRIILGIDREAADRIAELALDPAYAALLRENDALRAALAATPAPPAEIDVERQRQWAKWITEVGEHLGPDWACAECKPESDMLVSGFQCVYHEAAAYQRDTKEPE